MTARIIDTAWHPLAHRLSTPLGQRLGARPLRRLRRVRPARDHPTAALDTAGTVLDGFAGR
ncbi:MAG: hypothetical protein V9G98_05300 [Candidatus Competibacter sp.]